MSTRDVSIVIPVLSDSPALGILLGSVRAWAAQPAEIVVVAGKADESLESLCREHDCRLLLTTPCRGAQLDLGAGACGSTILWFLHADAEPEASSLEAIGAAIAGGAKGGYFQFKFQGPPRWQKTILQGLIRLRTRLGGIPYGDQGLFVRRDAYAACGGFAHEPLFEDAMLVRKLRMRGRFEALRLPIGVATRRWERDGWWRRSFANRWLALAHAAGVPARRLAPRYYAAPLPRKDLQR
ncbi:MAG TPA: glycosyl transferase family 2 [Gammaproteobacteria bacterium]|jgi:rSAM/selenodomain-associated transferase 2